MIKYICDTCLKEFKPQDGIGEIKGFIHRMNAKLEKQTHNFVGNYCSTCLELILNFIAALQNELHNTPSVAKPTDKEEKE